MRPAATMDSYIWTLTKLEVIDVTTYVVVSTRAILASYVIGALPP